MRKGSTQGHLCFALLLLPSDIAEERLQSYAKTERASESYQAQYFDPYRATRAPLQCKGNPDDSLSELCEVPEQDEHLLPPNFEDEELTSLACNDPLSPLDPSTRGYGIGMYGLNIALTEQNGGPSNCGGTGGSIQWFDPFAMGHDPGRMGSSPPKRNASRDFLIRQRLGGSWSRNSSTSLVNAPLIGTRDRGSSGRFDSIVSWNSVRGSWTSTSFTDVDAPGPRRDVWGSISSALRSGSDQFQFDSMDGPTLEKRQLDEPNVIQGQKASLDPAGRTSLSTLPLTEDSRSSLSRRGKEDFSFRGVDARPSAARYRSL